MPSPCCVPFCTTGSKCATEKVSSFSFPKDEVMKEQWLRVIPHANLVVTTKLKICEKHFTEDHIRKTWESHSDISRIVINMKRPRLQANAVPSIFPLPPKVLLKGRKRPKSLSIDSETTKKINLKLEENDITSISSDAKYLPKGETKPDLKPKIISIGSETTDQINMDCSRSEGTSIYGNPKYISESITISPLPPKIISIDSKTTDQINLKRSGLEANTMSNILVFPSTKFVPKSITIPASPLKMTSISSKKPDQDILGVTHVVVGEAWSLSEAKPYQPLQVFSSIVKDPKSVILPKGWEYKFHCGKKSFVSFYVVIPYDDDTTGFLIERQITFGVDMVIHCKIFNKEFDLVGFGISVPTLPTVEVISKLINYLNEYQVCVGGPLENQYAGVSNSTSKLCVNGHWRHTKCAYLLHYSEIRHKRCIHCMNLRTALRLKKKKMTDNELASYH